VRDVDGENDRDDTVKPIPRLPNPVARTCVLSRSRVLAHTVCPAVSNALNFQIYFKRAYERTRCSIALPRNALLHLRVYTGDESSICERGWVVGFVRALLQSSVRQCGRLHMAAVMSVVCFVLSLCIAD
jgi:hypothetical protein